MERWGRVGQSFGRLEREMTRERGRGRGERIAEGCSDMVIRYWYILIHISIIIIIVIIIIPVTDTIRCTGSDVW